MEMIIIINYEIACLQGNINNTGIKKLYREFNAFSNRFFIIVTLSRIYFLKLTLSKWIS